MIYRDFEYDGRRLSEFGFIICNITGDSDKGAISTGNRLTFNTINVPGINKFKLSNVSYESPYTTTLEIMKSPCDNTDQYISVVELSDITKWLNKKSFKKFKLIIEDNDNSHDIYYNVSFMVNPIVMCGGIIGIQLELHSDAPFGYYEDIDLSFNVTDVDEPILFNDMSDEVGYIYPNKLEIKCNKAGDLVIVNSQEPNRHTVIQNCVQGETITFVENLSVDSSKEHIGLYNDFNYVFPRIVNGGNNSSVYVLTDDNTENAISFSLPCDIKINYSPICKAIVM